MENKYSLKDYREAKTVGPHLDAILKVLDLTSRSLHHFKTYLPVSKILKSIDEQRIVLEAHRVRYAQILKTKGQF